MFPKKPWFTKTSEGSHLALGPQWTNPTLEGRPMLSSRLSLSGLFIPRFLSLSKDSHMVLFFSPERKLFSSLHSAWLTSPILSGTTSTSPPHLGFPWVSYSYTIILPFIHPNRTHLCICLFHCWLSTVPLPHETTCSRKAGTGPVTSNYPQA